MHVLLKKIIYKPYFFSWLVSSSCSLSCMIKIWILFLEITVTPFQRSGGIYVAAIFTAKKFTGKMYFVRKLYFLSELDVHLNVLYSVRGLKITVFSKTSWTRKECVCFLMCRVSEAFLFCLFIGSTLVHPHTTPLNLCWIKKLQTKPKNKPARLMGV